MGAIRACGLATARLYRRDVAGLVHYRRIGRARACNLLYTVKRVSLSHVYPEIQSSRGLRLRIDGASPCLDDVGRYFLNTNVMLHLSEAERSAIAHSRRVSLHHL